MSYGLPYIGSKSQIAEWVVNNIPSADTFVDLFAGGCAVTHAAMLSGKYKRFICNDISGTPFLFREAMNGEFEGMTVGISRDEFFASDDLAIRLLYSFGNNARTYLWGGEYEKMKVPAEKMLSAPSVHERRKYYRQFMKELARYTHDVIEAKKDNRIEGAGKLQPLERLHGLERLQPLERLEGIERLEGLERLETMRADYRNVNVPKGAVVYADPPYRNTGNLYGGFDFKAFDEWLGEVDFPVYVSEYTAPAGCVCIAEKVKRSHLSATNNSGKRTEKIFIQERFVK